MFHYFAVATILLFTGSASAGSVCCPDVGCFDTDGPFNHLPSPSCIKVFFALFNSDTHNTKVIFNRNSKIPSAFDPKKRTVFLAHGYMNSHETSYMNYIKDALLNKDDYNVILTDWAEGAGSAYYPNSASNTRVTGAEIAYVMKRLTNEAGLGDDMLWCIGFSLGAHVCGHAGRGADIDRVTGLDPAGPWFHGQDKVAKLGPDSGRFVDVIHTDGSGMAAYYGLLEPLGHIDFYPNGGYNQPGCMTSLPVHARPAVNNTISNMDIETYAESLQTMDLDVLSPRSMSCCHGRAVQYFAESVIYDECFVARQICDDEKNLPRSCRYCNGGGYCASMGYEAGEDYTQRGKYYLETKSKSVFCRF